MNWNEYYNRVSDWAESTRVRRTYELTEFGEPWEIAEALCAFEEEENAAKLAKKALAHGVKFSSADVCRCIGVVEWDTLTAMAQTATTRFSKEELEDISGCIDEDVYEQLAHQTYRKQDKKPYGTLPPQTKVTAQKSSSRPVLKPRRKRKNSLPALLKSWNSLSRTCKKLIDGPPTSKQRLAAQRAKARRNKPWWDK